ncbi:MULTISPECIES: hypothetical protein [Nostoc]|uniref:Uncharacterized protein n=2 Tax=Nostoc TaxID=1177 RepID=A0ABR8IJ56_9NOSO|nr:MULTISPECIES: hypothetical protein [Nostoc]MBD2564289.1 hypothetical protein [Nostoc linckia FACHB-391]MBD2650535.1 hypothetical protein [Nostoc foliaceum FACHB-393]
MNKNYKYLDFKTSAAAITSLIFIVSCPFLFLLALPSIFLRDDFIGVWLNNPGDFPFSFSMALFVALSCSAVTLGTFSVKQESFSVFVVIIAALIGCILNLIILPINAYKYLIYLYLLTGILLISPIILVITLTIDSFLVKVT